MCLKANVVGTVGFSAGVSVVSHGDLHLLSSENQALLHGWDAFLLLDLLLDRRDLVCARVVRRCHWEGIKALTLKSLSMSSSISLPVSVRTLFKESKVSGHCAWCHGGSMLGERRT